MYFHPDFHLYLYPPMYKGNLPMSYLKSVLDIYELVLQESPNCSDGISSKVKQDILNGLGNKESLLLLFIEFDHVQVIIERVRCHRIVCMHKILLNIFLCMDIWIGDMSP